VAGVTEKLWGDFCHLAGMPLNNAEAREAWRQLQAARLPDEVLGLLLTRAHVFVMLARLQRVKAVVNKGGDAPGHAEFVAGLEAQARGDTPEMRALKKSDPANYRRIAADSRRELERIRAGAQKRREWPPRRVNKRLRSLAGQARKLRAAINDLREVPGGAGLDPMLLARLVPDLERLADGLQGPTQAQLLSEFRKRALRQIVETLPHAPGPKDWDLLTALIYVASGNDGYILDGDSLRREYAAG
jgi:hypothetical protein